MEKPPIHRASVQHSQRAAIGVRQDRLTAEFRDDRLKASGDLIESFVPGDAFEGWRRRCWYGAGVLAGGILPRGRRFFRPYPPHRIQHSLRRINAVQVFGNLGAQKTTRNRMRGIALNLRRPPIFHRNQHTTSIRTVVRACSMDDVLHTPRLYGQIFTDITIRRVVLLFVEQADHSTVR